MLKSNFEYIQTDFESKYLLTKKQIQTFDKNSTIIINSPSNPTGKYILTYSIIYYLINKVKYILISTGKD